MAGGFGFIAAAGSLRSWCFADPATWCEPARPLRNRWLRTAQAHICNAATADGRPALPGLAIASRRRDSLRSPGRA